MAQDPSHIVFTDSRLISVELATENRLLASIVPVVTRSNGIAKSAGTAFCIGFSYASGEGIFLTARHVIEELSEDRTVAEGYLGLPFAAPNSADGRYPNGRYSHKAHGVPIDQIVSAKRNSDLAILVINVNNGPTAGLHPVPVGISFDEPVVGAQTVAFGWPQYHFKIGATGPRMFASAGPITEVYPTMRDRSLITYPSFRTESNYPHAMSGGPIFSGLSGRVIGVVSTGFDTGGGAPIGFGAVIGSILEMRLQLHAGDGSLNDYGIASLLSMGVLKSEGAVTMRRGPDGVSLEWTSPQQ